MAIVKERVLVTQHANATVTVPMIYATPLYTRHLAIGIGVERSCLRPGVHLWLENTRELQREAIAYLSPEQARMLARRLMAEADEAERGR